MNRLPSCLALALGGVLVLGATLRSADPDGEWRAWAADKAATRYSPLDQINRNTVKNLTIVWRQSGSPEELKATANYRLAPSNYEHTPLMIGGLLYVSTGMGTVAALDAATGKMVWFDPPPASPAPAPPSPTLPAFSAGAGGGRGRGGAGGEGGGGTATRGVAFWNDGQDGRIIAVVGQYLVALNAKTGKRIMSFGTNGQIDLRLGLSRPVETYSWRSAPIVVNNVIVVGSVVGDINNASRVIKMEAAPGDVRGYDARTGRQLWTFKTIPRPGEFGNETWEKDSWAYTGHTNVWGTMSGDEDLGHVYLPLTTPTNDWYGGHRPGANLFAESIVALDVKTGRRLWHFQGVHHGMWDYDFPCPPVLADITVNGRKIKALAQPSKQAFLYVFDRTNGKPIWPIEERPVLKGDVPGEWYSPTQPVPLDSTGKPFAYDLQGVNIDDLIDFTPELRGQAVAMVDQYAHGSIYFPPVIAGKGLGEGKKGAIHFPGTYGGTNWPGASLDPETGILYVPSAHTPVVAEMVVPPEGSNMNFTRRGWEPLVGPGGLPIFKPPYGRLVAIDLNRGQIKWTVANGNGPRDHPLLKDLNLPPLGNPGRVGPMVTKSLVFMGEGSPAEMGPPFAGGKLFRAFDKATGAVVWETELPGAATAPAMTYMWKGKQYIVVAIGWPGQPGELVALALN
jgi:quinoprotein glucose dehydrogenase